MTAENAFVDIIRSAQEQKRKQDEENRKSQELQLQRDLESREAQFKSTLQHVLGDYLFNQWFLDQRMSHHVVDLNSPEASRPLYERGIMSYVDMPNFRLYFDPCRGWVGGGYNKRVAVRLTVCKCGYPICAASVDDIVALGNQLEAIANATISIPELCHQCLYEKVEAENEARSDFEPAVTPPPSLETRIYSVLRELVHEVVSEGGVW